MGYVFKLRNKRKVEVMSETSSSKNDGEHESICTFFTKKDGWKFQSITGSVLSGNGRLCGTGVVSSREEISHVQGQEGWSRGDTPRPR